MDIFGRLEKPLNFIMVLVADREFHRLSMCTLLTPQASDLYQIPLGSVLDRNVLDYGDVSRRMQF